MKLSDKEFMVLAACDTEADLSIAAIAKRVGSPEHVVRRTLQLLTERGAIHRRVYLNSFLLGTIPYLITFALNTEGRSKRKYLMEFLSTLPEVSYIADVTGKFHVLLEARFSSPYRMQDFLDRVSVHCGAIFSNKQVLFMTAMYDFPVFAPASHRPHLKEFATAVSEETVKLAHTDYLILDELAKKWDDSNALIARKLKLPVTSFDYHLQALRKKGVLLGARYFVNLAKLGYHTFYHMISTKGFDPGFRQKMLEYVRGEQCVHCLRVFVGPWDFVIESHYENAADSMEFAERLLEKYSEQIATVDSYTVLGLTKISDCTVPNSSEMSSGSIKAPA